MKLPSSLSTRWAVQARRIDALSLRERVFLFLSGAAALLALTDLFFISPHQAALQQLHRQQTEQADALKVLRAQVSVVGPTGQATDPVRQMQAQLNQIRAQQQGIQTELHRLQSDGVPAQGELFKVIETLLKQHERLQLRKLQSMDGRRSSLRDGEARVAEAALGRPLVATTSPPRSEASPSALPTPAPAWQGVEVQISGRYLDLVAYVRELERALPQVRWGAMRVEGPSQGDDPGAGAAHSRLTLQLYVRAAS